MFRTFVHRAEIDDDRWGLMSVCFRFSNYMISK